MRKFVAVVVFAVLAGAIAGCSGAPTTGDKNDGPRKPDVGFVPTDEKIVAAMLKMAAVKEGDTVLDLGCGDGRIVVSAVKDFKAKAGIGIDIDPERMKDCAKRMDDEKLTAEQKKKLTFKQGDVFDLTADDFKDVDVVALFLLPDLNKRLKPMLRKALKPGARVVSHNFHMGEDWIADAIVDLEPINGGTPPRVFLWTIK